MYDYLLASGGIAQMSTDLQLGVAYGDARLLLFRTRRAQHGTSRDTTVASTALASATSPEISRPTSACWKTMQLGLLFGIPVPYFLCAHFACRSFATANPPTPEIREPA